MTLLSLFMTSTGIFCFVPISQRLMESGIIPMSNSWRFRKLLSVLAPTFYVPSKDKTQLLLPADRTGVVCPETKGHPRVQSPLPQVSSCSPNDAFATDHQRHLMPSVNNEWSIGSVSPLEHSPTQSFLQSTSASVDTFYGNESASFNSETTLCDHCNNLLRREIPPDHIPSVIRALALFEANDQLSDAVFNECDIVALTNAFSMLRL